MEGQEAVFVGGGIGPGVFALPVSADCTADVAAEVVYCLEEQGSTPAQVCGLSPRASDVPRQFRAGIAWGSDEDFVDSIAVHIHDLELEALPEKMVGSHGNAAQLHDYETGQCLIDALVLSWQLTEVKEIFEFVYW